MRDAINVDTRFYRKAAMDLPSKNHSVSTSFKTRTRTYSVRFRKDVCKIFRKGGFGSSLEVPWISRVPWAEL